MMIVVRPKIDVTTRLPSIKDKLIAVRDVSGTRVFECDELSETGQRVTQASYLSTPAA